MFHGFDLDAALKAPLYEKHTFIANAMNHISAGPPGAKDSPDDRKRRFLEASAALYRAFALAVPHEEALRIRDAVGFIQAVRGSTVKLTVRDQRAAYELEAAIGQIVAKAVVPEGVIDIFAEAGIRKPDISILSDEFLAEVRAMPQRNLAAEALQKLLTDEIRVRSRKNTVQARRFSEMLEQSIQRYQNRTVEAAQVILELIELARQMRDADRRGEELGLSEAEVAFYDALAENESAVEVLGDETLRELAMELVETVRRNAAIDWTVKESVRAKMRVMVRRLLRRYKYPPDKQEAATQTVLEQAELLGFEVAA